MCMTDFFEYDNCKYPYKTIYFQNDNCSYIIATENLELKLLPDGENYDSGLAQKIDDRIFFFVPEGKNGDLWEKRKREEHSPENNLRLSEKL